MKVFVLILLAGFTGNFLTAQLVLPDLFIDDEEDPGASEIRVQQEDTAAQGEERRGLTEGDERMEQQMRQMMQAMQVRRPHFPRVAEQDAGDGALFQPMSFSAGPESLVLELEDVSGHRTRLSVPNQTLMLNTRAGRLPVRLNEVREMTKQEGRDTFTVLLMDNDRIEGMPQALFAPSGDDGGELSGISLETVRFIRLSLSE
jgi:hypothetical protein